MPRAHLTKGIIRKVSGAPATGTVEVLDATTNARHTEPLYSAVSGTTALPNPFTFSDGLVDFYMDNPDRVHLVVTPDGGDPQTFPNVDVPLPADADHGHGQYALLTGATFTGPLSSSDLILLERYAEHFVTPSVGVTTTLNCDLGMTFNVVLNQNTTLAVSGLITTGGRVQSITVVLKQDATGGRVVTFPAGTKWGDGAAPPLATTPNAVNVVTLMTLDAGATWLGFLAGRDIK